MLIAAAFLVFVLTKVRTIAIGSHVFHELPPSFFSADRVVKLIPSFHVGRVQLDEMTRPKFLSSRGLQGLEFPGKNFIDLLEGNVPG
ncbi:MAG: hypothetical protein KDB52_08535, partial [Solirubrobacterales bacterium]|nr:hypothetical protein [Solirubrobacterales bacterium]